jgi:hypothetical protein
MFDFMKNITFHGPLAEIMYCYEHLEVFQSASPPHSLLSFDVNEPIVTLIFGVLWGRTETGVRVSVCQSSADFAVSWPVEFGIFKQKQHLFL